MASPAAAAQVTLDEPCKAPGATVRVAGTGFWDLLPYAVSLNDVPIGAGAIDGAGSMSATFPAPVVEGVHVVKVTDALGNRGRATLSVARADVRMSPMPRRPDSRVRFLVSGIGTGGPSVWLHWVDPAGRLRASVRLGTATGACGSLESAPRRVLPRDPRTGTWRLQIDTRMSYDPQATPRVVQTIRVNR